MPEPPPLPEPVPEPKAVVEAEARLPTDGERRLHPWSWLFVLIATLRQFVLPLAALVVFGGRGDDGWQFFGAAIVVAVLTVASVWRYFTYRYRIDHDSLFVRSGLLQRELRQIPFSRIHNVALKQSLLHRLFGVAEVKLESAGGTKPEAEMRVLKLADALALERLIRHRGAETTGDNADAAAQAQDAGETLLALPTPELVRLGLISNRGMVVVAGAFALAWQVFPDDMVGKGIERFGREAFGHVDAFNIGWMQGVVVGAAFVLMVLVLIRLLSVLLAIVRYHGFRLSEHGRRLTVERGLLSRVRASVPRRRIQAWTLREGLLHRLFRRRSLDVDTATSQVDPSQEKSLRELAPIATPDTCDALLQRLLRNVPWPPPAWSPLHPRAWLRLLLGDLVFCALLVAAACWWLGPWGLLALSWLAWCVFAARRHASRAGYVLDGDLVAVREGWWSRNWRLAEIDKLQALQLRQSPLDRAFGMASLWMDTAGATMVTTPLRIRFLPVDEARAVFSRLERDVARRPLRW